MKMSELITKIGDREVYKVDDKYIVQLNGRWIPATGEGYYYLADEGCVTPDTNTGDGVDSDRMLIGNCFKSSAEAFYAYNKRFYTTALLDAGGREKFDPERENWMMSWTGVPQPPVTLFDASCPRALPIYFDSHIEAEEAIKSIGVENIMKYVFGVVE